MTTAPGDRLSTAACQPQGQPRADVPLPRPPSSAQGPQPLGLLLPLGLDLSLLGLTPSTRDLGVPGRGSSPQQCPQATSSWARASNVVPISGKPAQGTHRDSREASRPPTQAPAAAQT